jgi:hypothetical protein
MRQTKVFEAEDGTQFATAAECKTHEAMEWRTKLSGLTDGEVCRALDRADPELANAFEKAGAIIARKRRESGDVRRRKKGAEEKLADVGAAMQAKKASK